MKILHNRSSNMNELLFENRNKSYGAYALRKEQDKRTLTGFLFACSLFVVAAAGMKFFNDPKDHSGPVLDPTKKIDSVMVYTFENQPEPEILKKEQPKAASSQKTDPGNNFTPSNTIEDSVRTNKDLKNLVIGPKNPDTTGTGIIGKGTITIIKTPEPDSVWKYVPNMPEFAGDFGAFLKKGTNYPQMAKDNGIEGVVYVNFVIDQGGNVTDAKVINTSANDLLKKEALRVIGKSPKWKPGSDGTRNVKVSMTVPFRFKLK